jgi:hypothetical protein
LEAADHQAQMAQTQFFLIQLVLPKQLPPAEVVEAEQVDKERQVVLVEVAQVMIMDKEHHLQIKPIQQAV